jgi:predicted RNA binding protein YcfA (HicA-like mRNA interferase family)
MLPYCGEAPAIARAALIAMLIADGWICVIIAGSHHQFRHPTRPGRVTVKRPDAEIALGTLRSIFRQAA